MKKLYLTKEQSNFVELAIASYIRDLEEECEKKGHTGIVSELVSSSIQQGQMVLSALHAQDKKCPACTGTGTIHQNCILR